MFILEQRKKQIEAEWEGVNGELSKHPPGEPVLE